MSNKQENVFKPFREESPRVCSTPVGLIPCAGAELRESQKTAGYFATTGCFASALTLAPKMRVPTKGQVTNTEDKKRKEFNNLIGNGCAEIFL